MDPILFVATKEFIVHRGKVLILRESNKYEDGSNSSKYDVVGGRIKPGQRFDESLVREISEETGLTTKIGSPFCVGEWRPIVKDIQWQVVGTFFECFSDTDVVKLSEDHDDYQWINPLEYSNYPLIENLKPAFENYNNRSKK